MTEDADIMKKSALRNNFAIGTLLFLLALIVRLVYLWDSCDNPTFFLPIVDSITYHEIAKSLAQGGPITKEFFWQQFFYPVFLSIVYFFSNSSILCAKLIQILLGCFTAVLTWRLGQKIFGKTAAILAGFIVALYGPLVFFDAELLDTGWAAFWSVVLVLLFLNVAETKKLRHCLAFGFCAGLSVLTRPNFIPFLAAGGLWLIVIWLKGHLGTKRILLNLAAITAAFLLFTLPVASLNKHITGRFSFLPATGGLNFYKGNNPDITGVGIRPGLKWEKLAYLSYEAGMEDINSQQRFFYAKAFDYIRTHPLTFIEYMCVKTAEFFSSREMPGNIDIYLFGRWSAVLSVLVFKVGKFGFPFGPLLPLALVGLFCNWPVFASVSASLCRDKSLRRGQRKTPILIVLFLVLYSASVIIIHIESRYRLPIVPIMAILAGAALATISEMLRSKRRLTVAAIAVLCVAAIALTSLAGPFYAEKKQNINYEAELYYGVAGALIRENRLNEAADTYRKAILLKPDYADAHCSLANTLSLLGRLDEAVEHYTIALRLEPDYSDAHHGLGILLQVQGKTDQAIYHYQKVLQQRPDSADTHNNLGVALQAKGRLDEAAAQFRQTLLLRPNDIDALNNLGNIFRLQANYDQAMAYYRQAMQIKPDNPGSLNGLAWILANHPDTNQRNPAQAVAFAQQAAKLTSYQNAEVLETLASAYASAGQFDNAVKSAQAALNLVTAAGNQQDSDRIQNRLQLYKQKKP
jgi:tetratricopeptide (TPR) repeat protein